MGMGWDDDEGLAAFDGADCSEDGEGCEKTVEFGGYVKILWGCTITFKKKGKKFTKNVACGGKSFEGVGKKNLGNGDYETKKKNWTKQNNWSERASLSAPDKDSK